MMVMKKYSKDWINKTYVTPHSYDLSLYSSNIVSLSDNLKISYWEIFMGHATQLIF